MPYRLRGKSERVQHNPFEKLKLTKKRRKPRIWTQEEVEVFAWHADRLERWSAGTAVILNEWIGQREGDVLALGRSIYRDGALRFVQSKTGEEVYLPVDMVPHLAQRLQDEAQRWARHVRLTPTMIIASEATGRAYSVDAFGHVFREVRAAAAKDRPDMATLWFMRLRHTAVVRLAESGATVPWIASITGHSLSTCHAITELYNVRTDKMAVSAFQQRLDAEARERDKG